MNKKLIKDLKAVLRSFELSSIVFSNIQQSIEKEQFLLERRQADYDLKVLGHLNNRSSELDERIISISEEAEALQEIEPVINNLIDLMRQTLSKIETDQYNADIQPIIRETTKIREQIKAMRERDPLFNEIARDIVSSGVASTSGLQRRYSIGFARAGKLMDQLEAAGIVGPSVGGKMRDILIDTYRLEEILNEVI